MLDAQSNEESQGARLEKLESENESLRSRLDALENTVSDSESKPLIDLDSAEENKLLNYILDTDIGGYVVTSYFYDGSNPDDGESNGYLWTRDHNEFTLNKVGLTLGNPAERSGTEWGAGFQVHAIFGEDAPIVNSGGEDQGLEDIRQAYVELNIPVGTGLNVKAGQLISLLNFESGDGGVVNPNFSQGNQWFFTGNPPGAGVQTSYEINDQWGVDLRIQNGMYQGTDDNNDSKTGMGAIRFKPNSKSWIKLLGFGGAEGLGYEPGGNTDYLTGVQILAGHQLQEENNINVATELTYMHWDEASVASVGSSAEAWSAGIWLWGDIVEKFGLAVRGDVVSDEDGAFTSGLLGFPTNTGQKLYSATLTANYRPHRLLKIQPEIRYEYSDLDGAFDGSDDRIIFGLGAIFSF